MVMSSRLSLFYGRINNLTFIVRQDYNKGNYRKERSTFINVYPVTENAEMLVQAAKDNGIFVLCLFI